jgi:RNA polymerase sigma factor (sigma-70 family)
MTGESRSDSELLAGLPRQPELMGVLYERHALAVFRYLARRAGPPAAEDLLSEVFVAALTASSRVVAHDSGSALPWLYGIASNVLRAHFRQRPTQSVTRGSGMHSDPGMDWDAVDDRLDAHAERGRLRATLTDLSESDRELLLLVAWEGLTHAEAATANEAPFTISGSPEQANFGQKSYTWAQLNALPTNPAKLWTILKADEQLPFTSDPAQPKSGESDLFQSIMNTLTDSPTTPALRKALYEDAAKIPGVTVTGKYTDSLGRTGTALHVGLFTMVIDTSNGQVLSSTVASAGSIQVCGDSGCTMQPTYGSTSVYISVGPAYSAPKVAGGAAPQNVATSVATASPTSVATSPAGTGAAS